MTASRPPSQKEFHAHDHGAHAHGGVDAAEGPVVRRALLQALLLTAGFA